MKCPECHAEINDENILCEKCGATLPSEEDKFEEIFFSYIEEEEKDNHSLTNTNVLKKRKKKEELPNQMAGSLQGHEKKLRYALAAILVLLMVTLFLPWYQLGGYATYLGFVHKGTTDGYLTEGFRNQTEIEKREYKEPVLILSPFKFQRYLAKADRLVYVFGEDEQQSSVVALIHRLYVYGGYLLAFLILLALGLLFWPNQATGLVSVKFFSYLAAVYIMLNYFSLRIPLFSLFGVRAKAVLADHFAGQIPNVKLNGIEVANYFYDYRFSGRFGLYLAAVLVIVWFVLSSLLVEMARRRENERASISEQKR